MKRKSLFVCCVSVLALLVSGADGVQCKAQNPPAAPLSGFQYGPADSPEGNEWESPEKLALNKEQPHAWFFSFQDKKSAVKVLPENSAYWQSLDGKWKFNWVPVPEERPAGFCKPDYDVSGWDDIDVPSNWNVYGLQEDGSMKYGLPIYVNQPVIFMHQVKPDDWRGGVMRTPPTTWTTYRYRNEVGSYRRSFSIPENWDGREVFITFDGVDSFFYLWINGHYVGFSKNSRNAAEFNISDYLVKGENTVAVEVYRNSDGSFLESQDMFRLPGIFRTVALHSTPEVQIRDLVAIPDLDASYKDGSLSISTEVRNLSRKKAKGYRLSYSLYRNELYSDDAEVVKDAVAEAEVALLPGNTSLVAEAVMNVKAPSLWSAEYPWRYVLVAQLKDNRDRVVETVSSYVGFRKVEIRDTPAEEDEFGLAGRYYYINNKTVKLKGVNRHETNPSCGHAITRKMMEAEVMLMKQANINHVRNSHYPDSPYWYYLCDKYGIYLEDEANIESHEYYYGEASLSHPAEWRDAHVARVMEMVHSDINHPSIVIWSLGNEAGPGNNFVEAYNALKKADLSRPVQYERNNKIVDMGSNQYPSIAWTREAVKGRSNLKYPFHISEYAHSMGNACGNLDDYWTAIESTNFFCGGAIWDWIDQAIYHHDTRTGERYLAYGGDFGDTPNNGQFVMNGIIFADMEPKPQYYEVKKVYQHIGMIPVDEKAGTVELFNKYYFKDLSEFDLVWSLWKDGTKVQEGIIDFGGLDARQRKQVTVPYDYTALDADAEYFAKLQFVLNQDMPWAKKGFVQAEEQYLVKKASGRPEIGVNSCRTGKPVTEVGKDFTTVNGEGFNVIFDMNLGTIHKLEYNGKTVIVEGNGPKLDPFRAFTNNDNWFFQKWYELGLHNLKHKVTASKVMTRDDGSSVLAFTVESQAPNAAEITGGKSSGRNAIIEKPDQKFGPDDFRITSNQIWTVYADGSVEFQSSIVSNQPDVVLPRLGYVMKVPQEFSDFTYYGRGPIGNYADRCSGQFIEIHKSTVADEFENFPKPQEMGNHENVRWCALTDKAGQGAVFVATDRLSVAAQQYTGVEMTLAPHPYQLPEAGDTYLHLDLGVTGLGGNSCGQGGPLPEDRVYASVNHTGFIIRPAGGNCLSKTASVKGNGEYPFAIVRSRAGDVQMVSAEEGAEYEYSINGGKPQEFTVPFNLREAGTVTAWFRNRPEIKYSVSFSKIDEITTTVISASSEESGSGDAAHLTDGDPNTYWHTMHSVTVAKHPHWVDLDAGEVKMIKGFIYLPRQKNNNGNIKDYTIQISVDGKDWGEPVVSGRFAGNDKPKKVLFEAPVKGRYIRFTALSEQRGRDFASGAELTILAE